MTFFPLILEKSFSCEWAWVSALSAGGSEIGFRKEREDGDPVLMQDQFLKQHSNNTKHFSLSLVLFQVGFKPAGGIRSAKDSLVWLSLIKEELGDEWMKPELFRIGASTLLADIERQVRSSSPLSLEHLTNIFKKEIKSHLFKEDLQMDNAQMERCSTSLLPYTLQLARPSS